MYMLNKLTKQEILSLAKEKNISIPPTSTKKQIIEKLNNIDNILHNNKIKSNSSILPTEYTITQYNNDITVLPQSHDKILIIWSSDPTKDYEIKAWKLSNQSGLDILLPNYARSVFINIDIFEILEFSLYKIDLKNNKILFNKYFDKNPLKYYNINCLEKTEQDKIMLEHFNGYNCLSNHLSSSNNFIK